MVASNIPNTPFGTRMLYIRPFSTTPNVASPLPVPRVLCRMSRSTSPIPAPVLSPHNPSLRSLGCAARGTGSLVEALASGGISSSSSSSSVYSSWRGGGRQTRGGRRAKADERRKIHKDAPVPAGCAEYRPDRTFQHPKKHEASANLPMPNRSNSQSYTCLGADIRYCKGSWTTCWFGPFHWFRVKTHLDDIPGLGPATSCPHG